MIFFRRPLRLKTLAASVCLLTMAAFAPLAAQEAASAGGIDKQAGIEAPGFSRWHIFAGAEAGRPDEISRHFGRRIGPVYGAGFSWNRKNRLNLVYAEHDYDATYQDAADALWPSFFKTINPAVDPTAVYYSTAERMSDSSLHLEYLFYFQGRDMFETPAERNSNHYGPNWYPYLGVALGSTNVEYSKKWQMVDGKPILERLIDTTLMTGKLILGADFRIDRNLSLGLQGEYGIGDKRRALGPQNFRADATGATLLTSADRLAVETQAAFLENAGSLPFVDLAEFRFSARLTQSF